jgi:osmotically inducible protein OsmC
MAYTAIATTKAGREGHVESSDGVLKLDLAMPGSHKPNATNPEQLFAAGYSACFGSAIMTLNINGNDYSISVKLKPQIDGLDRATAEELVHKAHEVCPYSKATRNNIKVDIELV